MVNKIHEAGRSEQCQVRVVIRKFNRQLEGRGPRTAALSVEHPRPLAKLEVFSFGMFCKGTFQTKKEQ